MSLEEKIRNAVKKSGYPLEQRVGHLLMKKEWCVFYSVNYLDPDSDKERELDILAYKEIGERRLELRISCKRDITKPWVFFTEDASRYYEHGNILKITPVDSDPLRYKKLESVLSSLLFFKNKRRAINFTAFSGDNFKNDTRSLMKDGFYSALNSVYHHIFPYTLVSDQRGTIYFFVTVFDGQMYESFYNADEDKDEIREIQYCQWEKKLSMYSDSETIKDNLGREVPFVNVLYWFSDWFRLEIVKWSFLNKYLDNLEKSFMDVSKDDLNLFGKPWRPENFPKTVEDMPKL